jgi:HD-GYP domain-containing protein (c-di-GMP phosphodiesterase class II)
MERETDLVEMCMEQISTNMEELTFLRELAGHMKLQSASRGVDSLCAGLLATLTEAASAEYAAFLKARDWDDGRVWDIVCECRDAGEPANVAQIMETLLDHFPIQNSQRGFVFNRNGLNPPLETRLSREIRSCLAVEVRNVESPVGWLLAVNKKTDVYRNLGDGLTGELEFGTHEATLFSSVASLLVTHAQNVQLFEQKEALFLGTIRGMVSALDARDKYTRGHSERVATTARDIAAALQLPETEIEDIYISGLLHDIGKIGVPDHVLLKPGRLTDEEFDIIKQHPTIGYEILKQIPAMSSILPGVLHHHEAVDGRGYPYGLKGQAIPLMARILAVADSFDAMTSTRAYRPKMPLEKAFAILREHAGVQWDAQVVDVFLGMQSQCIS